MEQDDSVRCDTRVESKTKEIRNTERGKEEVNSCWLKNLSACV